MASETPTDGTLHAKLQEKSALPGHVQSQIWPGLFSPSQVPPIKFNPPIPFERVLKGDMGIRLPSSIKDPPSGANAALENVAKVSKTFDTYTKYLQPVARQLVKRLRHQMNPDTRLAYIYVLHAPMFFSKYQPSSKANEQWIKVGISDDPDQRRKDIVKTCGIYDLSNVLVLPRWFPRRRNLVYRIEQLCHDELMNYRRNFHCGHIMKDDVGKIKRCHTPHTEYFAVDEARATRTVTRWMKFLEYDPYNEKGELKDCWEARLNEQEGWDFRVDKELSIDECQDVIHERLQAWMEKGPKAVVDHR
jgi:hypothetical protein